MAKGLPLCSTSSVDGEGGTGAVPARRAEKRIVNGTRESLRKRLSRRGLAAILGGNVVGEVFSTGTVNFLNIYNTVLVVRLVSTWFPNAPQSIVQPLRCGRNCLHRPPSTRAADGIWALVGRMRARILKVAYSD